MVLLMVVGGILLILFLRRAPFLMLAAVMGYMTTQASGWASVGIGLWMMLFLGLQGLQWYVRRPRRVRLRGGRS